MTKISLIIGLLFINTAVMAETPMLKLASPSVSADSSSAPAVTPAQSTSSAVAPMAQKADPIKQAPVPKIEPMVISAPSKLEAPVKIAPAAVVSSQTSSAASAPIVQKAPDPVVSVSPSSSGVTTAINPFSGEAAGIDDLRMQLSTSRIRTQLLEESLKQATIDEDFKSVKAKKAVEQAQALTSFMREESAQKELGSSIKSIPSAGSSTNVKTTSKKTAKKSEPKPEVVKPVTPITPRAPAIAVTSIINVKGQKSAVLDVDGNVMAVADNEQTEFGLVKILSDKEIKIGSKSVQVHSTTIGRLTISDNNKPEDKNKTNGGASSAASTNLTASAAPSNASRPAGTPASLPPGIMLPPPVVAR